jgi:hypothetical protein
MFLYHAAVTIWWRFLYILCSIELALQSTVGVVLVAAARQTPALRQPACTFVHRLMTFLTSLLQHPPISDSATCLYRDLVVTQTASLQAKARERICSGGLSLYCTICGSRLVFGTSFAVGVEACTQPSCRTSTRPGFSSRASCVATRRIDLQKRKPSFGAREDPRCYWAGEYHWSVQSSYRSKLVCPEQ